MGRKNLEVPKVQVDYEDNYIRHLLEAYTDADGNLDGDGVEVDLDGVNENTPSDTNGNTTTDKDNDKTDSNS